MLGGHLASTTRALTTSRPAFIIQLLLTGVQGKHSLQASLEQSPKCANHLHHYEICLFREFEPWIAIFRLQRKHYQYKGKLLFQRSCSTRSPCTALQALKGRKQSRAPRDGRVFSSWRPNIGRNTFHSQINRFSWKIFHFANTKWSQGEKTHIRPQNPKQSLLFLPANHWWRHLLQQRRSLCPAVTGSSLCNLPAQDLQEQQIRVTVQLGICTFQEKNWILGFPYLKAANYLMKLNCRLFINCTRIPRGLLKGKETTECCWYTEHYGFHWLAPDLGLQYLGW